ncbi:hypothetical protein ElyMa_005112600 [Elysia marginata]|uniref:Uncharacterized protein n=1 Tax=Elysia marginata TaxID=1093978 RepID=A0AAV4JLL1_9GAST|nr:hypothetical protein ElyMa_005112600 [Elysia marginata]
MSWRNLSKGKCSAYWSSLITHGNNCCYSHRIDRPVVTNYRPLRSLLYQSFTGHGSPASQRLHVCLPHQASGGPAYHCSISRSSDCRCWILTIEFGAYKYSIMLELDCVLARVDVTFVLVFGVISFSV